MNRPEHYGISSPGGVPAMQGHLGYDSYVELAQTRAAAQKSVALQTMQTALLGHMAGTLNGISNEMAEVRRLNENALAVQQQLLQREIMQQQIEELIYQTDKLVVECSNSQTDIPPSSRFFLMQGFLSTVEQQGIGTPIIKGRDNKTAFERVVTSATNLVKRLLKDPEVQQAIAWAKKLEDRRRKIEQEATVLREKLETLQEKRRPSVPVREVWANWMAGLKAKIPAQYRTIAIIAFVVLTPCWFPLLVWSSIILIPVLVIVLFTQRSRLTKERNVELDKEIAQIEAELGELLGKA
jgi:hypothetical protein